MISAGHSAYGVDVKYRTDFVNGKPVKTRMLELAESLGQLGVWTRMHYVYPYPSVDNVIPLMAHRLCRAADAFCPTPTCAVSARQPRILKLMEAPGQRRENIERIQARRATCPDLTHPAQRLSLASLVRPRPSSKNCFDFLREAQLDRVGCFCVFAGRRRHANDLPDQLPDEVKEERPSASRKRRPRSARRACAPRSAARSKRSSTTCRTTSPSPAPWADAPEDRRLGARAAGRFAQRGRHRRRSRVVGDDRA